MVAAVIFAAYLWQTAVIKVATAIQIQHVTFTPSELKIYVHNIGEGHVTVVDVYIDEEKFGVDRTNCIVAESQTNVIPEGATGEVIITRGYTQKIHIQVVCSDGTGFESDYRPPAQ
jgi:P pilus assembly chaperone PapD